MAQIRAKEGHPYSEPERTTLCIDVRIDHHSDIVLIQSLCENNDDDDHDDNSSSATRIRATIKENSREHRQESVGMRVKKDDNQEYCTHRRILLLLGHGYTDEATVSSRLVLASRNAFRVRSARICFI
jgi:hypothetical protein